MQGFNAGSWWAMSGINLCIGINWTCLSRCVDGEPGESAFSIHKLSGLFQGQVIQALTGNVEGDSRGTKKEKHRQMHAYTLEDKQG